MVACKKFHTITDRPEADARKELQNLQILQKSNSKNEHICFHLATIVHGSNYMILLPWARHLDLHIFLLEGHKYDVDTRKETEVYDFEMAFPNMQKGRFVGAVYVQMANLASALHWLHQGITNVGVRRERVQAAHMDLKPDNILIDDAVDHPVGKWLLTDFGISAMKKDSNFVSILDVYATLQTPKVTEPTLNTYARRRPGAYQAPEVEQSTSSSNQVNGMPIQTIGRKGDIWSAFLCSWDPA